MTIASIFTVECDGPTCEHRLQFELRTTGAEALCAIEWPDWTDYADASDAFTAAWRSGWLKPNGQSICPCCDPYTYKDTQLKVVPAEHQGPRLDPEEVRPRDPGTRPPRLPSAGVSIALDTIERALNAKGIPWSAVTTGRMLATVPIELSYGETRNYPVTIVVTDQPDQA